MKKSKTIVERKKIGRPVTVEDGTHVGVRLPKKLVERINECATKHKIDRSAAIRALIERGLKS